MRRKHARAHAPPTAYCFLHDRYMSQNDKEDDKK